MEEEITLFNKHKEEELKKLRKEKLMFNSKSKENISDRRYFENLSCIDFCRTGKEELEVIKKQLIAQEEASKKEITRLKSELDRIRSRHDAVVKRNQELEQQVKVLEKNRIAEMWQGK
jgi:hypothetical protein